MYIIRHKVHKHAYIKECILPARLLEWTDVKEDAQQFEFEREVKEIVDFISKTAWNVEYEDIG